MVLLQVHLGGIWRHLREGLRGHLDMNGNDGCCYMCIHTTTRNASCRYLMQEQTRIACLGLLCGSSQQVAAVSRIAKCLASRQRCVLLSATPPWLVRLLACEETSGSSRCAARMSMYSYLTCICDGVHSRRYGDLLMCDNVACIHRLPKPFFEDRPGYSTSFG